MREARAQAAAGFASRDELSTSPDRMLRYSRTHRGHQHVDCQKEFYSRASNDGERQDTEYSDERFQSNTQNEKENILRADGTNGELSGLGPHTDTE